MLHNKNTLKVRVNRHPNKTFCTTCAGGGGWSGVTMLINVASDTEYVTSQGRKCDVMSQSMKNHENDQVSLFKAINWV